MIDDHKRALKNIIYVIYAIVNCIKNQIYKYQTFKKKKKKKNMINYASAKVLQKKHTFS